MVILVLVSKLSAGMEVLHNSCNMGTRDLPDIKSELFTLADMYARSPQALVIHIRKITRAHVTTIKGNISSHDYFH